MEWWVYLLGVLAVVIPVGCALLNSEAATKLMHEQMDSISDAEIHARLSVPPALRPEDRAQATSVDRAYVERAYDMGYDCGYNDGQHGLPKRLPRDRRTS